MSVLALIPARAGSKSCPGKNLRELGGLSLWQHAVACALAARCDEIVVSSDMFTWPDGLSWGDQLVYDAARGAWVDRLHGRDWRVLPRPAELAQDDTPMIAVVQHALQQIPGPSDQIVVLLQPTQPFRKPEHIIHAVNLLQESEADSVVSVVALPLTHSPEMVLRLGWGNQLSPWGCDECGNSWNGMPKRRQDAEQAYKRDGTVYCFRRKTLDIRGGSLYGYNCQALLIDPADSCELDTEQDWLEVERRWAARHG